MKARFIGSHNSMGFQYGQIYTIWTEIKRNMLWLFDVKSSLYCPYSNMETMLDNWEIDIRYNKKR